MLITEQINHLVMGGAKPKNPAKFNEFCLSEKGKFKLEEDSDDEAADAIEITIDDIKRYLIEADSDDILAEFNNIKTFLYENCIESHFCPGVTSSEWDSESQSNQKWTDIPTLMQILSEVEKRSQLKKILQGDHSHDYLKSQ